MHIHCVQHAPFEGPGQIAAWAQARGHALTCTDLSAGGAIPDPLPDDLLILLGGPMGVHDHAQHPWLIGEIALIARHVGLGGRVLGICLGAQLIATALGAPVTRNSQPEIGWFPVQRVAEAATSPFGALLPEELLTFHWHQDIFALPAGAVWLASSAACAHQAFALGRRVLGIQFHPEVTPAGVAALVHRFGARLRAQAYVQPAPMLAVCTQQHAPGHTLIQAWLDLLVRQD